MPKYVWDKNLHGWVPDGNSGNCIKITSSTGNRPSSKPEVIKMVDESKLLDQIAELKRINEQQADVIKKSQDDVTNYRNEIAVLRNSRDKVMSLFNHFF